jgi:hypothetical protein
MVTFKQLDPVVVTNQKIRAPFGVTFYLLLAVIEKKVRVFDTMGVLFKKSE